MRLLQFQIIYQNFDKIDFFFSNWAIHLLLIYIIHYVGHKNYKVEFHTCGLSSLYTKKEIDLGMIFLSVCQSAFMSPSLGL